MDETLGDRSRKSFWRRKRGLLYMIVFVLEMKMP